MLRLHNSDVYATSLRFPFRPVKNRLDLRRHFDYTSAVGLMSRSSRGLGHRPFTAATRVRISYGMPTYNPSIASKTIGLNRLGAVFLFCHDRSRFFWQNRRRAVLKQAFFWGATANTQICMSWRIMFSSRNHFLTQLRSKLKYLLNY